MHRLNWLLLTIFWWMSGCSDNQNMQSKLSHPTTANVEQNRKSFMLKEVYLDNYCFLHEYYWKDSLANVRAICESQSQVYDSVNQVRVERHAWQSGYCRINTFLLISQGGKKWFIPFCDELQLGSSRGKKDTTFFKKNLAITRPLNVAVSGLTLTNRPLFMRSLLNLLFGLRIEKRIVKAEDVQTNDDRAVNYIRRNVGRPNTYFYHSLQGLNSIWEFDDLGSHGVQVKVIRPGWYVCFAM